MTIPLFSVIIHLSVDFALQQVFGAVVFAVQPRYFFCDFSFYIPHDLIQVVYKHPVIILSLSVAACDEMPIDQFIDGLDHGFTLHAGLL